MAKPTNTTESLHATSSPTPQAVPPHQDARADDSSRPHRVVIEDPNSRAWIETRGGFFC